MSSNIVSLMSSNQEKASVNVAKLYKGHRYYIIWYMSHGYSSLNYRQLRGKNCTGYKGYKCSARGRRQTGQLSNDLALFSPSASRRSSASSLSFMLCPNLKRYVSNFVIEVDILSPILSCCLFLSLYLIPFELMSLSLSQTNAHDSAFNLITLNQFLVLTAWHSFHSLYFPLDLGIVLYLSYKYIKRL